LLLDVVTPGAVVAFGVPAAKVIEIVLPRIDTTVPERNVYVP
jgi:hypothetical protein